MYACTLGYDATTACVRTCLSPTDLSYLILRAAEPAQKRCESLLSESMMSYRQHVSTPTTHLVVLELRQARNDNNANGSGVVVLPVSYCAWLCS